MATYYLAEQPIPEEFRIYEERLEVAGIAQCKREAQSFVKAKKKWLEFERDPRNRYDTNAFKVIGYTERFFGTKRHTLGYVPREAAQRVVEAKVDSLIRPRLLKTYLGRSGFVEIEFQIIGPKASYPSPRIPEGDDQSHYTDYVERVKWLKAQNQNDEAIDLLGKLVEETEKESRESGGGVAPWYYEQLAILYRKQKRYDEEVAILERYERQTKAPGVGPKKLAERLGKARKLRDEKRA